MKHILQFILLVLLISCTPETTVHNKTGYKVIGVKDGDTVVILMDSTEQVVRFAHVDCPEKKQPFGTKAKQFVSGKCFGTTDTND